MTVRLKVLKVPRVGLEADGIVPEAFANRSVEEIRKIELWVGRRKVSLGEVFEVSVGGKAGKPAVEVIGDASRIKRMGQGMAAGSLRILGHAGMHLGNQMSGGEIHVEGSVSSWCGCEMSGGSIRVTGDAGHYLGGAYRGSTKGITGGIINVERSVGNEAGCRMADGVIRIGGTCGDFVGVRQTGGMISVGGTCGLRPGANMKGGSLVLNGRLESLLPGAEYVGEIKDPKVGEAELQGLYMKFKCDLAERTQGELLLHTAVNPDMLGRYQK